MLEDHAICTSEAALSPTRGHRIRFNSSRLKRPQGSYHQQDTWAVDFSLCGQAAAQVLSVEKRYLTLRFRVILPPPRPSSLVNCCQWWQHLAMRVFPLDRLGLQPVSSVQVLGLLTFKMPVHQDAPGRCAGHCPRNKVGTSNAKGHLIHDQYAWPHPLHHSCMLEI